MSTVPLPMKRFPELAAEAAPRLALADDVGEADAVGDPAPSATLAWVLAPGVAAACPAWDCAPQPATTASIAADTALANARRHRHRG
jgi:hypothetical protein